MLWLCGTMQGKKGWPERPAIVLVACDCAELVLPIFEKKHPNDKRVRECIEVTRKWAAGEATIEEVRKARNAAYAAYAADAADAADAAADAAAPAAYATDATATTATTYAAAYADAAATAAYAYAAAAATDADAAAARTSIQTLCADFCRNRLVVPEEL